MKIFPFRIGAGREIPKRVILAFIFLAALVGLHALEDASQAWKDTAVQQTATSLDRQAAAQRRAKLIQQGLSRVRLAESEWDKPYGGPVTVPFADHSVVQIPSCPADSRPYFMLERMPDMYTDIKLDLVVANGYWVFDLYRQTANGKVYLRLPAAAGTLTTLCRATFELPPTRVNPAHAKDAIEEAAP